MSDDEAKKLTGQISVKMREAGFKHCTFEMKSFASPGKGNNSGFPSFGMDVKVEGKSNLMLGLGAKAFARGNGVNFGKAAPTQIALLGHEASHVVQQK